MWAASSVRALAIWARKAGLSISLRTEMVRCLLAGHDIAAEVHPADQPVFGGERSPGQDGL